MGRGKKKGRQSRTVFSKPPVVKEPLDYELLDAGRGEKFERFGPITFVRPAAHAIWSRRLEAKAWRKADASFQRNAGGDGRWKLRGDLPEAWILEAEGLRFVLKTTNFGHLGLFPEQRAQWAWLIEQSRAMSEGAGEQQPEILNLFAYTGGSTLATARGGCKVCHVDAARGIVDWARENARQSALEDHPIRWIVEDVQLFLARELRRERRYQGIILDPPSFGRGRKGEVWKIEEHLTPLLQSCRDLLADDAGLMLLSCHSPGFTPRVLENLLRETLGDRPGRFESGEMVLEGSDQRGLPNGCFARWSRGGGDGA